MERLSEPASDLTGRQAEVATISALIDTLALGRGGMLWIEGEPGIGKSALAAVLEHQARERGMTVLRGTGQELQLPFPLRLMASCLTVPLTADAVGAQDDFDGFRREITHLLRGSDVPLGAADPVLAAAELMLDLVDRQCARGPAVLIADDLQFADEPSLRLWHRPALAVDQIPLLVVGVTRLTQHRPVVARLREAVRERQGTVMPLGLRAVRASDRECRLPRPGLVYRAELQVTVQIYKQGVLLTHRPVPGREWWLAARHRGSGIAGLGVSGSRRAYAETTRRRPAEERLESRHRPVSWPPGRPGRPG